MKSINPNLHLLGAFFAVAHHMHKKTNSSYLKKISNERVNKIFCNQHGVISRSQAISAGISSRKIKYLLKTGSWKRLHRGVYRHSACRISFKQKAMAACLAAQGGSVAVVSGITAARIHKLEGIVKGDYSGKSFYEDHPIEIMADKRLRIRNLKSYKTSYLPDEDIAIVDGIPVTSVARTIVGLIARAPGWAVEKALDYAMRIKLTTLEKLKKCIDNAAAYCRFSLKPLKKMLKLRGFEDGITESRLEQKVLRILKSAGLPIPVLQYSVLTQDRKYRLDFAYPKERIGIEVDGFQFHRTRGIFDVDRRRANALLLQGWSILRITSKMKDEEIIRVVEGALRRYSRESTDTG